MTETKESPAFCVFVVDLFKSGEDAAIALDLKADTTVVVEFAAGETPSTSLAKEKLSKAKGYSVASQRLLFMRCGPGSNPAKSAKLCTCKPLEDLKDKRFAEFNLQSESWLLLKELKRIAIAKHEMIGTAEQLERDQQAEEEGQEPVLAGGGGDNEEAEEYYDEDGDYWEGDEGDAGADADGAGDELGFSYGGLDAAGASGSGGSAVESKAGSSSGASAGESKFNLRPARKEDKAGVYAVCLQTGDSGKDATSLYRDKDAIGNRWTGPYLALEPDLAFVLEDEQGVCGYVLGALDSSSFYKRLREEWLPPLQKAHPDPAKAESKGKGGEEDKDKNEAGERYRDADIYAEFHNPHTHFPAAFAKSWPSHLHIDLLPRAQRQGHGSRMIARLCQELARRGSAGVHLEMSSVNAPALSFYKSLGFKELLRLHDGKELTTPDAVAAAGQHVLYLGKSLSSS